MYGTKNYYFMKMETIFKNWLKKLNNDERIVHCVFMLVRPYQAGPGFYKLKCLNFETIELFD